MRSRLSKKLASACFVAAAMILLTAQAVYASHFRYGTITYSVDTVNRRTVTFQITSTWRRSFQWVNATNTAYFTPNVGDIVSGTNNYLYFNYGNGASAPLNMQVTSVDSTNDWFTAVTTLTYTYPSFGTYTPFFVDCCRLSGPSNGGTLRNNGDTGFYIWTTLTLSSSGPINHPPTAAVPPIVNLPYNFANANFPLFASDIDGDPLTYRLATPTELCGPSTVQPSANCPAGQVLQPAGLSVDGLGVVHFDTRAPKAPGQLWNTQIVISDGKSAAVVDVLILLVNQTSQPPVSLIDGASTPYNLTVRPGTPVSFSIGGTDTDPGATLTLSASGAPVGSSFTTSLPTTGTSPVSTTFNWTPTIAQGGFSFPINIIVTDNTGLQDFNTATIQVLPNLKPLVGCPPSPLSTAIDPLTGLADITVSLPIDDPDDDDVDVTWRLAVPPFTVFDTETTPPATEIIVALQHAFALGTYATEFVVTDTISGTVTCALTVNVNKAPQSITFDDIPDQVYGAGPLTLTATATSNEPVSFALISGAASLSGDQLTITGVGPVTVQASQAGNGVYAPATSVLQTFIVSEATPTIVVSGGTFPYDGLAHPATASVTGVGGNALPFTITYDGAAEAPINAGTYAVVVSFAGDAFHHPHSAAATLEITKVDPLITLTGGGTLTYDANYHPATATVTGVLGEDLSPVTITYNGGGMTPGIAGTYVVEASYAGNHNYNPVTATDTIIINKADPLITITGGGTLTFDNNYHPVTATAIGVIGEDLTAMTPLTITYNGSAAMPGIAGTYIVLASIGELQNYNAGSASTTIVINKADPIITITGGGTITFDNNYHPATATATGVSGEDLTGTTPLTITYNGSMAMPGFAGTYLIVASIGESTNYNAGSASVTLVINKADPVMAVIGGSFTYDGIAHGATVSATGPNAEVLGPLTVTYNGSASAPINAGSYTVLASFAGNDNYNPASATGVVDIARATPVVNATGGTFSYDGLPHPATASATGIGGVSLGPVVVTYNGSATPPVSGGSYTVLAAFSGDGNHTGGSATSTIVINAIPLTVTADDKTKIAGQANPALTATFAGLVSGDSFTPVLTTTATAASPVGTYPITVTPFTSPNYSITFVDGTLTVNPARQLCLDYDASRAHNSGSTIPVRLRLCDMDGSNISSSSFVLTALGIALAGGGSAAAEDAGNANPGGTFRHQSGGYMFNLQTTGLPAGAHALQVGVSGEPTTYSVPVVIR